MADTADAIDNPLDAETHLGLVRAALHPDERKFFKEYLGQESPDVMDYLLPQGRFANARQVRDDIVRSVIHSFIPSPTNPMATVGQARSIDPNFPIPPGLRQVPGETPQQLGPPSPKPTFLGSPDQVQGNSIEPYLAPRPGTEPMVTDPNALLPRSHQNLLAATEHRMSLRGFSPQSMLKTNALERLQELDNGGTPSSPNERHMLERILNVAPNLPDASTAQGREAKAKADLAELKAKRYEGLTDAQIADMTARSQANEAKAHDLYQGFDTRMRVLDSQIAKNRATGQAAGNLMGVQKERMELMQAKTLLAVQRYQAAKENFDQPSMDYWTNQIIDLAGGNFGITRDDPNAIQKFLGLNPQAHITPNPPSLPVPQGQPPTGNPMQFPNGSIVPQEQNGLQAPETITNVQPTPEANPEARRAQMKAAYNTMKDGETKVIDGKKFQRKGTQLIEVQ